MKAGAKTTEFVVVLVMIAFGGFLVWQKQSSAGITMATTFAGAFMGLRSGMKIGNGNGKSSGGT